MRVARWRMAFEFSCHPPSLCMDNDLILKLPCLRVNLAWTTCITSSQCILVLTLCKRCSPTHSCTRGYACRTFLSAFTLIFLPSKFLHRFFKFHSSLQSNPTLLPLHKLFQSGYLRTSSCNAIQDQQGSPYFYQPKSTTTTHKRDSVALFFKSSPPKEFSSIQCRH